MKHKDTWRFTFRVAKKRKRLTVMHDCPDCDMACCCDMEDHYQSAPRHCSHECDEDDDEDFDDYDF